MMLETPTVAGTTATQVIWGTQACVLIPMCLSVDMFGLYDNITTMQDAVMNLFF